MYNAIFFTYALVLTEFFDVDPKNAGLFLIPFAIGNLFGPWILGPLFDSVGRRIMISTTYATSGVLLAITAYLFTQDVFTATTLTIAWSVIFFFASAGASAAYLTVSEIFPMETRAMAIALFYAVGTGIQALSPWFFGTLIGTGDPTNVAYGFGIGAALMIGAAIVTVFLGVDAERRSLEDVAKPITARQRPRTKPSAAPATAR
jgi:MFS family permease